jgi:hypothetical protein
MNEDDTYKKLKRIPFDQMQTIASIWVVRQTITGKNQDDYEKYGWTKEEFNEVFHIKLKALIPWSKEEILDLIDPEE